MQLSILVHPDKNQDDQDRAQKAFEGINTHFYFPDHLYIVKSKHLLCVMVPKSYKVVMYDNTVK